MKSMEYNKIYNGDCFEVMKTFPDNSIDTLITDPPYGLSFMGKKWDYDVPKIEIWKECLRVLKPSGTALIFAGSRTQHRMAVNVEDAGFILKDCIMWLYGSGFPKAHDIGKSVEKIKVGSIKNLKKIGTKKGIKIETGTQGYSYSKEYVPGKSMGGKQISGDIPVYEITNKWNGWKSHGLKPAYEPILVAMKPNDGTYANNALKHGVAGLNIDGGRIAYPSGKPESGWSKSGADGSKGYQGTDTFKIRKISAKEIQKNVAKGRFPANIILECTCDTDTHTNPNCPAYMLDEQSGERKGWSSQNNSPTNVYGGNALLASKTKLPAYREGYNDIGGASRFFYVAKASKAERNEGCEGLPLKTGGSTVKGWTDDIAKGLDRNRPTTNHHPTVKPLKLMEYLCTLTKTPTGGIVLDPFAGSGTTLIAAKKTGRDYIGIEREEEYCKIAEARIKAIPNTLF